MLEDHITCLLYTSLGDDAATMLRDDLGDVAMNKGLQDDDKANDEYLHHLVISSIRRTHNDTESVSYTHLAEEDYKLLPLRYIAQKYFGKSAAWLSQRLNGSEVSGHAYTLNSEQKDLFNRDVQTVYKRQTIL